LIIKNKTWYFMCRQTCRDSSFAALNAFNVLFCIIFYLQNNALVPEVQTIQQQFFRQTGEVDASRAFGPSSVTYLQQMDDKEVNFDLGVELSIAHAPASFALPLTPHAPFNMPFRVTLRLAATMAAKLNVSVRASILSVDDLANITYWMPLPTADPRIVGAQVHAQLNLVDCNKRLNDDRPVYTNTHDFLFLGLQFTQTTNKEPIFIAFHADLPAPSPHLFTVFLIPTVVCSPGDAIDHTDAAQLLWKGALPPPPARRPRWTFHDFCTHVTNELQLSIALNRSLDPIDHLSLAHRAGFYLKGGSTSVGDGDDHHGSTTGGSLVEQQMLDDPCVVGGPTTEEEVESLQRYIRKTQAVLKLMREYYERVDPQIICGFSIGRREAISLLDGHPPGTFLIRFSYEAGSIAISHVIHTGEVFHLKLTMAQLQSVSLEELLSLRGNLEYLLDPSTSLRYPREMVLDRGYVNEPRIEQLMREQQYEDSQQYRYNQLVAAMAAGGQHHGFEAECEGGTVNETTKNPDASDEISTGPTAGLAHHQASEEGEQLPEQGFLNRPIGGGRERRRRSNLGILQSTK